MRHEFGKMPKKKVVKVKRAKTSQGKKDGRQESKSDKEADIERAKANAALWEQRLKVSDQSLVQYREACRSLARTNDELTNQLYRAEKDGIDITGFLRSQNAEKDEKINILQKALKSQEALAREQQNKLVEDYTRQINEMKELFRKKSSDFDMIQDGMKKIQDFESRKTELEQELRDIRKRMDVAAKEHRENLNEMEYTFFKEKARLEKEAEQTIALVVQRAHSEAVVQLDDASRSVFKENVCLGETLKYHMKEAEDLQKLTTSLAKENASLALDKNTFEMLAKKNAAQMEAQKEELSKLKVKVASLERAQRLKAEEPEPAGEKELVSNQPSQVDVHRLQRALATREKELGTMKRLASSIVEQRTELEQFFHEALAQVKQEITASRTQHRKEALQAYRWRLKEATAGKLRFPPIHNFHSTNSVQADMEVTTTWTHQPGSKVEISDLTWEQKEQVLRLLFAKMNRRVTRTSLAGSSSAKTTTERDAAGIRDELSAATFVTQATEVVVSSNPNSRPNIHTT